VTDENGRPGEPDDDLPCELKTADQIVAWNIAWYRKAAGFTQEQIGELLGGRSKRNISADERSWDGGHTREFKAQDLAALSEAFGIPIGAFFLPPADDGLEVRYMFRPVSEDLDMGYLMAMIMPDSGRTTVTMEAYRGRLIEAVRRYMGAEWADEPKRWQEVMSEKETSTERAEDARRDQEFFLRYAAKMGRIAAAYEADADGE
jgi:hypothetical protein